MEKQYLGDAVYVEFDGYMLTLTTENGLGAASNIIQLEPQVWFALQQYVAQLAKKEVTVYSEG